MFYEIFLQVAIKGLEEVTIRVWQYYRIFTCKVLTKFLGRSLFKANTMVCENYRIRYFVSQNHFNHRIFLEAISSCNFARLISKITEVLEEYCKIIVKLAWCASTKTTISRYSQSIMMNRYVLWSKKEKLSE